MLAYTFLRFNSTLLSQCNPFALHNAIKIITNTQSWVEDNASLTCLLCVQKFTMSNRRHHCRACGALVCDLCSAKRLRTTKGKGKGSSSSSNSSSSSSNGNNKSSGSMKASASSGNISPTPASPSSNSAVKGGTATTTTTSSATKSSSSAAPKDGDRVCDGCFNKLSFECVLWQQAMAKVRKHQEKLAAENPELLLSAATISSGGTNSTAGAGSGSAGGGSSTSRALNAATATRRALEQRGEKLALVAERSEEMRQVGLCD